MTKVVPFSDWPSLSLRVIPAQRKGSLKDPSGSCHLSESPRESDNNFFPLSMIGKSHILLHKRFILVSKGVLDQHNLRFRLRVKLGQHFVHFPLRK
jgi:hypothetical protein